MNALPDLQRRALELARTLDFGPEGVRVNAEIVALDPKQAAAWTRLGRCHLEQRQFDEAIGALRAALALDPSNGIATNLLNEVRRRRALTPNAAERATTGFGAREFAALETLAPEEAKGALGTRIELLFDAINASAIAGTVVEARRRRGESGSKLFHANSFHANSTGHIFAFHHGGRWEPQFNLGWFATPEKPASLRIGVGFDTSLTGRDPDRGENLERLLRYFERFQIVVSQTWKHQLTQWLGGQGAIVELGLRPPATPLLAGEAVDRLIACRNAAPLEWIFIGRWLFLDREDDARVLGDRAKLARVVDETFRALGPLWLDTYAPSTES